MNAPSPPAGPQGMNPSTRVAPSLSARMRSPASWVPHQPGLPGGTGMGGGGVCPASCEVRREGDGAGADGWGWRGGGEGGQRRRGAQGLRGRPGLAARAALRRRRCPRHKRRRPCPGSYRAAPPRSLAGSGLGPGGELARWRGPDPLSPASGQQPTPRRRSLGPPCLPGGSRPPPAPGRPAPPPSPPPDDSLRTRRVTSLAPLPPPHTHTLRRRPLSPGCAGAVARRPCHFGRLQAFCAADVP